MKTQIVMALSCLSALTAWTANPGLEIKTLGQTNTMVRITDPKPILLLPVEESCADSRVNILVNGEFRGAFYIRLAANTTDYSVPFDLTPYTSEGEVLLNIITPADRSVLRDASEATCWEEMALADNYKYKNSEYYRPAYHHAPLWGWMNDPNGMFYKDGTWHLYYQYNPYGSKWQNMSWGHATSTDLMKWNVKPVAIRPNGLGTIFSGSCALDPKNTAGFGKDAIIAMYTSADVSQVQSLAHSNDGGLSFTNYPGNPTIATDRESRDPNFFWNEQTGRWNLLLASALDHEMLIFSSPDMKQWTLESTFGHGYGGQDGVWECPDLFRLPVDGTKKEKWVLICNINPGGPFGGSAAQYFIGDFDGKTFKCDNGVNETRWMDYGKDHYAAVTWSDAPRNRRVSIAWMSNWQYANEVPTVQFRSANSLPRELGLFRGDDGDIYLKSVPVEEVKTLRGTAITHDGTNLTENPVSFSLPKENNSIAEIELSYSAKNADALVFELTNEKGEKVTMRYDSRKKTFSMDRQHSGLTKFSRHFPTATVAPTRSNKTAGTLRLFIDRCSIEAFDGEGRFAMTNLVFPTSPYTTLNVYAEGGKGRLDKLAIYPLKPTVELSAELDATGFVVSGQK